jgi:hypothetical protein
MKISEIITEAATSVLYHYANSAAAAKMLEQSYFNLKNAVGNSAEEMYIPTVGAYQETKKKIARKIAQKWTGLTDSAYMDMLDNLISGTDDQRSQVKYGLKLRGFTPEEIEKIIRTLSTKPQTFLPYFLSATRSRVGDFHSRPTKNAVLFTLNGDWLNQHYLVKPIDYWTRGWNFPGSQRGRESEDRVYSKSSKLPMIPVVKSIDMYLGYDLSPSDNDQYRDSEARRIITAADHLGIPVNFYQTRESWMTRNPRYKLTLDQVLKRFTAEPEPREPREGYRSDELAGWIELTDKYSTAELSKNARDVRYNYVLHYGYGTERLRNDLHNARPGQSDYPDAVKLVDYMVKTRIKSTKELVDFLKQKWGKIVKREQDAGIRS